MKKTGILILIAGLAACSAAPAKTGESTPAEKEPVAASPVSAPGCSRGDRRDDQNFKKVAESDCGDWEKIAPYVDEPMSAWDWYNVVVGAVIAYRLLID
jgi:hypothetical protein